MKQFILSIECDNDAFQNDAGAAIAATLRRLAEKLDDIMLVEDLDEPRPILDENGNTIGVWSYGEAGDDAED